MIMEFDNNKPIYLQLAEQLMDDVQQGYAHNGDRILSVREYAAKAGVNANTVMRTFTWLQQEGIIYNQRGIGYFYSDDAKEKIMRMRRKAFFDKEIGYFFDRLYSFGVSPESLANDYQAYIDANIKEIDSQE